MLFVDMPYTGPNPFTRKQSGVLWIILGLLFTGLGLVWNSWLTSAIGLFAAIVGVAWIVSVRFVPEEEVED